MTVVVGLSPGGGVASSVNLGATLARSAGRPLVVTAVVPEPWPPSPFLADEEFLKLQAVAAEKALDEAKAHVGDQIAADFVLRRARSVASGLLDVAEENDASYIVVGSSSSGALNRVAIGGVADRILHSSGAAVAVTPRGLTFRPARRLSRVTVAFGRGDGDSDLLVAATDRAFSAGASLRVACFAVRPLAPVARVAAGISTAAEDLVTEQWVDHLQPIIASTLKRTDSHASPESVEVVVGQGSSWSSALTDISWHDDELLVVGTSSSPVGRLFLGSHAAKIVKNSPVPVMLVPRSLVEHPPEDG